MLLFTTPPTLRSLRPVGPHRETIAQRLARAETRVDQAVRTLLEHWFTHLPEPAQSDIRSRFWERDRRLALAAFWELYLHELLRRLGYQLTIHPAPSQSGPRPDFSAVQGSEAFYVEALVHGPPTERWRAERRLYPILDVLHEIQQAGVPVRLVHVEYGESTPPLRELRDALLAWCETVDAHASSASRLVWQRNGWKLTFEAGAVGTSQEPASDAPYAATGIPGERALLAKLQTKARRYRSLDRPLLLALCVTYTIDAAALVDFLARVVHTLPEPVAGLFATAGLTPWTIARTPLALALPSERAQAPPPGLLARLNTLGATRHPSGTLVIEAAWRVFDLPAAWPASEET